ncbi:MFS transporter [Nocardia aurantia]|uniref:MFS transporter n=1 Tax=Nocardia aurantia TaxID=2585199 RepID=A0A7K0DSN0_9NOCA|nr:MFS transporter [Nocardia aurantia]MQY27834.1 hypothetical protein [Nocardia aurantia]
MVTRPAHPAARPALVIAVAAAALNLRPGVTSVGPILGDLTAHYHAGTRAAGLVTAAPVFAFALTSLLAPRLLARNSLRAGLFGALALTGLSLAIRPWGDLTLFVAGTFTAAIGIGLLAVLLPVVARGGDHTRLLIGTFTTALQAGATLGFVTVVPSAHLLGGWRGALAVWSLLAVVAIAALWRSPLGSDPMIDGPAVRGAGAVHPPEAVPAAERTAEIGAVRGLRSMLGPEPESGARVAGEPGRGAVVAGGSERGAGVAGGSERGAGVAGGSEHGAGVTGRAETEAGSAAKSVVRWVNPLTVLRRTGTVPLAVFFGLQALVAFVVIGWLPSVLEAAGVGPAAAGGYLGVLTCVAVPISFLAPPLVAASARPGRWLAGFSLATVAGISGFLFGPAAAPLLWSVVLGAGLSVFSLALTVITVRGAEIGRPLELSSAVQGFGYLIAAAGPWAVGLIRRLAEGWAVPLGVLLAIAVLQTLVALTAGRSESAAPRHHSTIDTPTERR